MSGTSVDENEIKKKNAYIDFQESGINALVESASRVIAPLWPISTFAARSPWMGLEKLSFEQVAGWLKNARGIDIFPSASMIQSARRKGEIDEAFVEKALQRWLDAQSFHIPRKVIERYCRAALELDEIPSNFLSSHEIKKLSKNIEEWNNESLEKVFVQPLSMIIEPQGGEKLGDILDYHIIKWCKLYLDESQATWTMPFREKGFYQTWKQLISYDPAISKGQRKSLKEWPKDAGAALEVALSLLEIPKSDIQNYLEGHLLSLPGWAGMILWRSQQSSHEKELLTEYLAIRISMEWALIKPYLPLSNQRMKKKVSSVHMLASWIHWGKLSIEEWKGMSSVNQVEYLKFAHQFNEMTSRKIWLEAWEQTYMDQLSEKIFSNRHRMNVKEAPLAQLAFCIDGRSEHFRRHLEKEGPLQTIGIAGFFGLPISTSELGSKHSHPSLPVILKPEHKIKEIAAEKELKPYQQRKLAANSLSHTFKKMKHNLLANLILPEVSGPLLSLQMLTRSFVPRTTDQFIRNLRENWLRKPETKLTLNHVNEKEEGLPVGFTNGEKVKYARQALKMMGLTKNFSPLVVFCGHGSRSINNPYASSLDCGACGGASSGTNAKVLAMLCNLQEVREVLFTEGIEIPKDTVFAAAEHITSMDELQWIYVPELSTSAQVAFDRIQAILPKVSYNANAERLSQLPNFQSKLKNPKFEAKRFAHDWSEVRPEWGLARNAAFIIGQRELTYHCDLEGRAFLHNYDWKQDENGEILGNIIAGAGTVAQWINLQYYASTVAPHYYGSGNKTTQTITSGLGVMQGNASDLLAGLPWQSVMQSDDDYFHSPLRLLIVIQAPNEYVKRLLENNSVFKEKVQNGWVRLASIDTKGLWEDW
ncbi:putative inorganic carbon transporter subunit DabA [Bacillus sp. FJAT-49736]|uniref:DUF2309 domain-containing protein n=1 Tax=Bacillus sp. FJAT-49736 TaxID=2833582 RepID=UPI001BC975C3|nr:putative inorganic carbon transporter subunit DabA [Bacillus sp. FJAT-49736]MBS4175013.1 DUF2309 family protein [Bacillus sp. FJAT-49736]